MAVSYWQEEALEAVGCKKAVGGWLLAEEGFGLLAEKAVSRWPLAIGGRRLLAVGYWLLAKKWKRLVAKEAKKANS